jgi:hypothetical protein
MTLVELRRKFVELSGRYDLVSSTSTWADKGANFFINAGQNFLDRLLTVPETKASIFYDLLPDQYSLIFTHRCRAILEVWINSDETRIKLEKCSLKDIKEYYSGQVTTIESGQPLYYANAGVRALDSAAQYTIGSFINLNYADSSIESNSRGIIITPPTDVQRTVEIVGMFSQIPLTTDSQENYWTIEVPELLLKAALYQLETFYRNTEGANDWLRAIQLEVDGLDKDNVEEDISDLDEMGD